MNRRIKQRNLTNKLCKADIILTSNTIKLFKKFLGKKFEVSGKLIPYADKQLKIVSNSVKKGKTDEADIIEYLYTFHTHPKEAYILYNTDLGFPSKGDFEVYLESFIEFNTILHLIVTLEGVYGMYINTYFINKKLLQKDTDKYIAKYFAIDKQNFSTRKGIIINNFLIKNSNDFVKYVNNASFKNNKNLFILNFVPWNKINKQHFTFNYIKKKSLCTLYK